MFKGCDEAAGPKTVEPARLGGITATEQLEGHGNQSIIFSPSGLCKSGSDAQKSLRAGALCEKVHLALKNDYERAYFPKLTVVFPKMTTSVVKTYTNLGI